MRIYRENIPPNQMMNDTSLYAQQVRRGLLCWNFNKDGGKQQQNPTGIWFHDTAWKEPVIVSGSEDWVNLWEPLHQKSGYFERGMFDRLKELGDDIDTLYYDDDFWTKSNGGITQLMQLLPVPIPQDSLWNIVDDLQKTFGLPLEKDYWYNQRHTIHFWISGLLQYIGSLEIQIHKTLETNAIIRKWIPTLKTYMDNRQYWQDFFQKEQR